MAEGIRAHTADVRTRARIKSAHARARLPHERIKHLARANALALRIFPKKFSNITEICVKNA